MRIFSEVAGLGSNQESPFSSSEWLKVYCSGVNLQAETASANAKRRDAAPFWTCRVINLVPRRFLGHRSLLRHCQRFGSHNFPDISSREAAASRSVATSQRTALASDAPRPAATSSNAHASPAVLQSSPAVAADWSATSSQPSRQTQP